VIEFYLWGWITTTAVAFWATLRFGDEKSGPSLESIAVVSMIAGAVWPVLAVGIVELGSLATYSKLRY
jgi:hypothetical protein